MKLIILFVTALALTSCNWGQTGRGKSTDGPKQATYTISNDYEGKVLYLQSGDQEIELTNSGEEKKEGEVRCVQLKEENFNNLRIQYASTSWFWSIASFDWLDGGAEVLCSNKEGDDDYQD